MYAVTANLLLKVNLTISEEAHNGNCNIIALENAKKNANVFIYSMLIAYEKSSDTSNSATV